MILYTVLDGLADSIFAIAVVYGMLFLLSLAIRPTRWLARKLEKPEPEERPAVPDPKPFSVDDVKDEDMMAAILVASIDARETMKTDIVVKNAKELK